MQPLLPISPGDHGRGRDLVACAEALWRAGCRQLLVREPQLEERALVTLLNALAQRFDSLIVHHRCANALELARAGGHGLHLPGISDVSSVRSRFKGLLGYSAHSEQDALYAQAAKADYITLSPIYRPTSKPEDLRDPLGPDCVASVQRVLRIPVFALGGINPERAAALRVKGVHGVAALGGVFVSPLPEPCEEAACALLTGMNPPRQLDLLQKA